MKKVQFRTRTHELPASSQQRQSFHDAQAGDEHSYKINEPEKTNEEPIQELSRMSQLDVNVGFPSSFSTQLLQVTTQTAFNQEQEDIKRSWEAVRKSRAWRASMMLHSKAARAQPLLPIPSAIRSVLHELQLVWLALHLVVAMWTATKFDMEARVRGPIEEIPAYTAQHWHWLPGQQEMNRRFKNTLIVVCCVYIPCALAHFNYVLDDLPDETPIQLLRKVIDAHKRGVSIRKTRRWSMDPRFDQFRRPRRRQWATFLLTIFSSLLVVQMIILSMSDCNQITGVNRWKKDVAEWMQELQRTYWQTQMEGDGQNEINVLDSVQVVFECCGKQSYKDWLSNQPSRRKRNKNGTLVVPFTCCNWDALKSTRRCDHMGISYNPHHFYQRGCVEPIVQLVIVRWMKIASLNLAAMIILMLPQIVLYGSIFQPREAIQQFARSFAEVYLFFTFWNQLNKMTGQRAKAKSVIQNQEKMNEQNRIERLRQKTKSALIEPSDVRHSPAVMQTGEDRQSRSEDDTKSRMTPSIRLALLEFLHGDKQKWSEPSLDMHSAQPTETSGQATDLTKPGLSTGTMNTSTTTSPWTGQTNATSEEQYTSTVHEEIKSSSTSDTLTSSGASDEETSSVYVAKHQ